MQEFFARLTFFLNSLKSYVEYHFTSKKKGVYVGCTDMSNLGDEAVFENIKTLFSEDVYLFRISYKYRLASLSWMRKFYRQADIIILGGGTLISRGPEEGYLKLLLQVVDIFKEASVFVFGAGVSEVQLAKQAGIPTDVRAWSAILNKSRAIAVRGNLSKGYLSDWRITSPVSIAGDPAILSARNTIVKKKRNKTIAVNFCNILGRIHGLNNDVVEEFGRKLFEILLRENWNVWLLPMAQTDYEFMRDRMLNGTIDNVKYLTLSDNIHSVLNLLESVDVFIGMRLHSIVFANAVYTPFHAIEYHSKTMDYLDMMGLADHSMRTDELDVEKAYGKILSLYDNLEGEQQMMFEKMQEKKKLLIDESIKFRSIIKSTQ